MNPRHLRWLGLASVLAVAVLIASLAWRPKPGGASGANDDAQPLVLYCAAGMRPPVEAAIKQYQQEYGVRVEPQYDGSGALLSTMQATDRGDLYLAADVHYVERARELGLVAESAPLAIQHAVIAVRKDDPKTDHIQSIEDLLATEGLRLTLADPEVAAISRAARKALDGTDLWQRLWDQKLSSVETVNLVANHLTTEVADAGVIWDSTARQYPKLRVIRVPEFQALPKQIEVAVMTSTEHPTEALKLMRYLSARDRGLEHFREFAGEVAEGDKWAERPELLVFAGGLNRPAIEKTIDAFEQREGVSVTDSYNGCGALVGQMRGGSRPDLYFACDTTFMTQVEDLFPESFDVSATDMVIIARRDLEGEPIAHLEDLTREGLKLGVCSATQSALGALSKQLLEKHQLWEAVQSNVRDQPPTADVLVAKVVAGGLDAAIVYKANTTRQADKLAITEIDDPAAHAVQPIAVAADSDHRQLAQRLMARVRSQQSGATFRDLGFEWLGGEAANQKAANQKAADQKAADQTGAGGASAP